MEGKASWQPIAMGGAEFNEIWDDTELIKAFSKSINYYKKMHDPNRKEEETPMPEDEGEEEYTDGSRMDESETQTAPAEAMAVSSSAPTTPAHKEDTSKKTPKRKSTAARKRIGDDEGEEAAADEIATQTAVAPGALDQGEHAAAYAGYDYSGYGGYYPHPQYPGAYTAATSPAAPSPKKTQRKKKDATQAVDTPAYDPAYAAYYPPAYPQGPYGASYPYGAPSGYPMMSPAYPPMPTTPHYHFHPVPHTHAPHHHHHHGHHHHHPPPPPPPPAGLDDEELKSLLNAWYYSGYYAGRYQAMRDATPK